MKPAASAVLIVVCCMLVYACGDREAMVSPSSALATGQLDPPGTRPVEESLASPVTRPVAQPDPPPMRVALIDEAERRAALQACIVDEVPRGMDARLAWLAETCDAAFEARDYVEAEAVLRELAEAMPGNPSIIANLSVSLGKQGRYAEALAEADRALASPDVHAMHANAIRASWLWHLDRRDEARTAFAAIPVPAPTDADYELYQDCRACFSASAHDLQTLRESIGVLHALGWESLAFVRGDVIFDQYRAEIWFSELVGNTLSPDL